MIKYILPLLTTTVLSLLPYIAQAQIYTPSDRKPQTDNSIGTIVTESLPNNFNITGGLRRGQNLFHSFTDFSIPTGGAANFTNPQGNQSIITRVTGSLNFFSDINGILNTNGANFLLINPNGVVFGPGAQLNVGKAFVTSTASGVDFVDAQGINYNFGVNRQGDPLLSIAPDVAFNPAKLTMNASIPGSKGIENYGTLQTQNAGQYIGLIGGNVNFYGGQIIAPGAKVELGGLSGTANVGLGVERNIFQAQFPQNVTRGDVSFINESRINVAGSGGGDISITARNLEILGRSLVRGGIEAGLGTTASVAGDIKVNATGRVIIASGSAIANNVRLNSQGKGGNIAIDAADSVSLQGSGSAIQSATEGVGDAGNTEIKTRDLSITNGAEIQTNIKEQGQGNAGNIKIMAKAGSVSFNNSKILSEVEGAKGKGGSIEIETGNVSITNDTQLSASTNSAGDAGNIKIIVTGNSSIDRSSVLSIVRANSTGKGGRIEIETGNLSVTNGGQLNALTFGKGDAGNIKIIANNGSVSFDGGRNTGRSAILNTVETGGEGKAGGIEIVTGNLSLTNGAQLQTSIRGKGSAGNIKITGTRNVSFDGVQTALRDGVQTNIRTSVGSTIQSGGEGKGGEIEINTPNLSVTNGAALSASTSGKGNAGNIKIIANNGKVSFDGGKARIRSTALSSVIEQGEGKGGEIEILTGNLSVTNGAQLSASTSGKGDAGSIKITANNGSVSFDGIKDGFISAASSNVENEAVGKAGGIEITTKNLTITNGAQLRSLTRGTGDAGSIKINAKGGNVSFDGRRNGFSSAASSGVAIRAVGKGGAIEITAQNLTVTNSAQLSANTSGIGDAGSIKIVADNGNVLFDRSSRALSGSSTNSIGKGGGIEITTQNLIVKNGSTLTTSTFGQGDGGNIVLNAKTIDLNKGLISSRASKSTGGNLDIITQNYLLLQNNGLIATDSSSTDRNGNGGNININSPLIIALPGNNDITANAVQGTGGKVNITSQGLFGIQNRPKGQASDRSNDITASSDFNQQGTVDIKTPGIDPGKDTGELPAVPNDPSNQISQACSASQRENKFYITGRGGLPPNASEPQESEALWQDAREVKTKPATTASQPPKFAPPAIGWVFQKDGRVRLIAAQTGGGATGTKAVCPSK